MHIRYRPQGPSTQAFISTAEYQRLETKRYIESTETPGKYGWFEGVSE